MRKSLAMAALLAAAAGTAGLSVSTGSASSTPTVTESTQSAQKNQPTTPNEAAAAYNLKAAIRSRLLRMAPGYRRRGPGWTNAHAKRVAAKKRRVKAHRSRK